MKMRSYTLLILAFFILGSNFIFAAKEKIGFVLKVEGKAYVMRKFKKTYLKGKEDLFTKDHVYTKKGRVSLQFMDSSVVEIDDNTHFKVKSILKKDKKWNSSMNLFEGTARFKVNPKVQRESFTVKTPVSVAGVRGTEFGVSHSGGISGKSTTTVFLGTVAVQSRGVIRSGSPTIVGAGQQTSVKGNSPPTKPKNLTPKQLNNLEEGNSSGGEGDGGRDGDDSNTGGSGDEGEAGSGIPPAEPNLPPVSEILEKILDQRKMEAPTLRVPSERNK